VILILLGVIVVGTIVMLGVFQMMSDNRSGAVIPMVRIAIASSSLEAYLWAQRLHAAEVQFRLPGFAPSAYGIMLDAHQGWLYDPSAYNAELWVRADDEEEARQLLGLPVALPLAVASSGRWRSRRRRRT
jgi:hypothetical protein